MSDQRNATHGLHSFGAKGADDFVWKAVDFRASREKWLAVGDGLAGGRSVERNGDFLFDEALVAGKIERVNF